MPSHPVRSLLAALLLSASAATQPVRAAEAPDLADSCFWQQVHWAQLTAVQQQLLGVIGWTEEKWESGDPDEYPPSEYKTWAELTDTERVVNEALGQTQESWDNPSGDCG